jgi:microcystin-dependent protein
MDGSIYNGDEYPELYAVIPFSWRDEPFPGNPKPFTLPNLNGAGVRGTSGTPGGFTGDNNYTLKLSNLPAHTHDLRVGSTGIIKAMDQYPTSTTRFAVATGTSQGIKASNVYNSTGSVNNLSSTQSIDMRDRALNVRWCIIAKPFTLPNPGDGTDGASVELRTSNDYVQWRQDDDDPTWANLFPVPADGAAGPAGPAGPPGEPGPPGDCDCDADSVIPPPDPIILPDHVDDKANICSAARRLAQTLMSDLAALLDVLDAISDAGGLSAGVVQDFTDVLMRGSALFKRAFNISNLLFAVEEVVSAAIRAQLTIQYEDELTCEIYCCALKWRQWDDSILDCFNSKLDITGPDGLIKSAINLGALSPESAADAFTRGLFNADNYCANFCDCPSCDGAPVVEDLINNPLIQFLPAPTFRSSGSITFAEFPFGANDVVKINLIGGSRCVDRIDLEYFRESTEGGTVSVIMESGDSQNNDSDGGFGSGSMDLDPSNREVNTIILRPGPGHNAGNLRILYGSPNSTITFLE